MKKLALIITVIFSLSFFVGCETDLVEHVLDIGESTPPVITSPENGASYDLIQAQSSEPAFTIEWSAPEYNLDNLPNPTYMVHIDVAGNNFANRRDLAAASGTSVTVTHAQVNQRLMALGLEPEVPHEVEIRVLSSINDNAVGDDLYSQPLNLIITPYDADAVADVKPIYMLGNGTEAGWDNENPLEMYHIEGGEFALVANLGQSGDMVKFLSIPGQWAPQWGQNEGDATEGTLSYRPTEDVPDPDAINISDLEPGYYRVVADTANLTYSITPSTDVLYLVGNATEADWDPDAPLELTMESPGIFTITTTLTAGEDNFFKFLEVIGQWAPQYGTDDDGTWESGNLVPRPTEAEPDPPAIPAPDESGTYTIEVNLSNLTYTVTPE